jgi:hypothetical protein
MRYALIVALMLAVVVSVVACNRVARLVNPATPVTHRHEDCIGWQETGRSDEDGRIVMVCGMWRTPAP